MTAALTLPKPGDLAYAGPYPDLFFRLPKHEQQELLLIHWMIRTHQISLKVVIGNLKGGVSKTTTFIYLILMLAILGEETLGVDADGTNRSSQKWANSTTGWPDSARIVSWAGKDLKGKAITGKDMLHNAREAMKTGRFRHVLVDTSPTLEEFLIAGLHLCDDFIVCSSPYPLDTAQIQPSVDLAAQIEALSAGERTIYTKVLIVKAKKNTVSLREAFEDLEEQGIAHFETFISNLDPYALSPSSVPLTFREYVGVLRELVESQLPEDDEETQA